jgi:antitoxin YefM
MAYVLPRLRTQCCADEPWNREARKNLFPLIEKVNEDRTPIEITSRRGDAVLLSRADYDALEETAHLLRVPANAKRLIDDALRDPISGHRQARATAPHACRCLVPPHQ